jgi:NAD(P)-dependent dehydrogenase (short-subunit alcohol dehydrogenase family)
MTASDTTSSTALVTGASRGFGRAIASALHAEGATVVAVARNAESLASLRDELGGTFITEGRCRRPGRGCNLIGSTNPTRPCSTPALRR